MTAQSVPSKHLQRAARGILLEGLYFAVPHFLSKQETFILLMTL